MSSGIAAVLVGLFILVNAGLALYHLGARSMWSDEAATWLIVNQHGHRFFSALVHEGGDMMLYYVLLHILVVPVTSSIVALRSFSVLMGSLAVPAMYGLGRCAFRRRIMGVACAALVSVSLPLVFWQQNARAYSLDVLLAAITIWSYIAATRDGDRKAAVVWVVSAILSVGTHPLAGLLIASEIGACALLPLDRSHVRRLLRMVGLFGLGCLPLSAFFLARGGAQIFWVTPPSWERTKELFDFLAGGTGGFGAVTGVDPVIGALSVAAWSTAICLLFYRYGQVGRVPGLYGGGVAAVTFVGPIATASAVSMLVQPVFLDRYLIFVLPSGTLMVVFLLEQVRWRVAAVSALVLLVYLHAMDTFRSYGRSVEGVDRAALYIADHSSSGDCVAFYASGERVAYGYYVHEVPRSTYPRQVLPDEPGLDPLPDLDQLYDDEANLSPVSSAAVHSTASCVELWLLVGHAGSPTGSALERRNHAGLRDLQAGLAKLWRPETVVNFAGVQVVLYEHQR